MLKSAAWRSLGGSALKVYMELRTRYNGSNNGQLILSIRDASNALGLGKATVKRAYDELQDKGFIKLRQPGRFYGRHAAEWELTDQSFNGRPPTNEWQTWAPPEKAGSVSDLDSSISEPGSADQEPHGSSSDTVIAQIVPLFGSRMKH